MCKKCDAVRAEVEEQRKILLEEAEKLKNYHKECTEDMATFLKEVDNFEKIKNTFITHKQFDSIYSILTPEQKQIVNEKFNNEIDLSPKNLYYLN